MKGDNSPSLANLAGKTDPELTSWVVDSGASDHMTPSDSLFHQATQPFLSKPVQIPNDQFIPVTHTDTSPCLMILLLKMFYVSLNSHAIFYSLVNHQGPQLCCSLLS